MLERWTRMREAAKALSDGRFDEALRLSLDPDIREHRKAVALRAKATKRLLRRAKEHRDRNNLSAAIQDVRLALEHGERSSDAIGLERDLRIALRDRDLGAERWRERLDLARSRFDSGDLEGAREALAAGDGGARPTEAIDLDQRIELRLEQARGEVEAVRRAVAAGDVARARHALDRARAAFPADPEIWALAREIASADRERRVEAARDRIARGETREALEAYESLRDEGPAAGVAGLEKLVDELDRGLLSAATDAFDEGDPRAALQALAARAELDRAAADEPEGLRRACLLFHRGLAAGAEGRRHLEASLLAAARSARKSRALDERAKRARSDASASDRALLDAAERLRAGDREGARSALGEALRLAPNDPLYRAFEEGLSEVDPERVTTPTRWARQLEEGDLQSAVRSVATALPIEGLGKEGATLLGRAVVARGEAAELLARAEARFAEPRSASADPSRAIEEALALDARAGALDAEVRLAPTIRARADRSRDRAEAIERADALVAEGNRVGAVRELAPVVRSAAGDPGLAVAAVDASRRLRRLLAEVFDEAEAALEGGSPAAAERCLAGLEGVDLTPGARARRAALAARLDRSRAGADEAVAEARARLEAFDGPAARAALGRMRREFPGHPAEDELARACDEIESAGPEVARVRRLLADGRPAAALAALDDVPGDVVTTPVVRELREAIDRASSFSERFFVRVEEGSDYLVFAKEEIRIGNVTGRNLDLAILASLSSEHAVVRRSRSFRGGTRYELEALDGRACLVNDEPVVRRSLADGDRIRLGDDLEMRFRIPCRGSTAAALELADGFDVDGARTVLLISPNGKDGRLVVGAESGHILAPEAERPVEIWRRTDPEGAGEIVCHCLSGVVVDGEGGTAEATLRPRSYVECGPCRLTLETFVPRNSE